MGVFEKQLQRPRRPEKQQTKSLHLATVCIKRLDDIRIDNVLPFRDSREEDDEKHVHPLQLDVIDRLIELYSNEGEVVLTPFMGVGSEVYSPVSMGRKAIGIELKDSYFKQAKINLGLAAARFDSDAVFKQDGLFEVDLLEAA